MTDSPTIMILRPYAHWNIVGAELRRVSALSRYMEPKAAVRPQWVDGDADLLRLATLCEELQADSLYTRYANKKVFRHTDDFWAADDAVLRQHVKHTSDQRLLKAVALAARLDIPILFAPTDGAPLHIEDRLTAEVGVAATPVMSFHRHEQGISYRLKLSVPQAAAVVGNLTEHHITVLGYDPGVFIMDRRLLRLDEGFSGKLLLPFVKKEVVEIPRHLENDYFRRFILRNVTRAEIEAEGFDISDTGEPTRPILHTDSAIDGRPLLTLRFRYGDSEYAPDSTANGRVTLTATDDGGFRFIRQLRDRRKEQHYTRLFPADRRFDTTADMVEWLRQHGPQLRRKGFDVVQPKDSAYYIGPLNVEQSDTWHGDWLQTDVTIVIDDGRLRIPFLDLRDTILRGEQVYMLPTGELLLIPPEWLKRYTNLLLLGMPKGKGFQRHRCQLTEEERGTGAASSPISPSSPSGPSSSSGSSNPSSPISPITPNIPPPSSLRATLRPYQTAGYRWLWHNFESQTGCCLSDEMGLGKTLQTIALLLKYKEESEPRAREHEQRVSPQPGFLFSEEEMSGVAPSPPTSHPSPLPSLVVAPASVVHNWRNELQRFAPSLTVCTYTGSTGVRRDKRQGLMRFDVIVTTYRMLVNDIDYLADQQFGIAVFDESQAFKTATSQVHSAVVRVSARHRLALSGTPVENSLMELWSLMNVLNPPLLGSQRGFQQNFAGPIARHLEDERTTLLQRLIAPYFLKRTKEEVLTDLPLRQDEVVVCPMTDTQATRYAEELSRARNEVLAATAGDAIDAVTGEQRFHILAAIQRLRHIANGEGKLNAIFEHLEALRGTAHKVLLFSEYVSMLNRVAAEMQARGWDCDMLTGSTANREQVIRHFQETQQCQFFLISLKAGGVGLNLTAADYVMLIDPWWNAAAEEQAIARAHRIGQQQPVFVYRFVAENTLEQQILTLQERKQSLIDSVMPFLS